MRYLSKHLLLSAIILSLLSGFGLPLNTARAIPVAIVEEGPTGIPANTATINAWPTAIANLTAIAGTQSANTVADVANLGQIIMEWIETLFTETLRDALIQYLTDQVVAYILGQSDGVFVGDWQSYLADVATSETQQFIGKLSGIDICAPFKAQIQLAIAGPSLNNDGLKRNITCSLDQLGQNFENFQNDFRNGSWISYDIAFQPNNNVFGVLLTTSMANDAAISRAKSAAVLEAQAGGGFLNQKECSDPNDPKTCIYKNPGQLVGGAVQKALIETPFDRIIGAKNLAQAASSITNALITRVLQEGIGALQGSVSGSPNIDDYVDQGALEKSVKQRFQNEKERLTKNLKEAIKYRKQAKNYVSSADTRWLKYTYGATDIIVEAARQIKIASEALGYSLSQMSKITRTGQIKLAARSDADDDSLTAFQKLCRPVRTGATVDNTGIPQVIKNLDRAQEILDTFTILHDEEPDAYPEFVVISERVREINEADGGDSSDFFKLLNSANKSSLGIDDSEIDPTEEDNDDQIAFLEEILYQIEVEMQDNTEETRFRLGELQSLISPSMAIDAEQFKNKMKAVDNDIEKIFKVATDYANRLDCFKEYNPSSPNEEAVVIPWFTNDPGDTTTGKPARNPRFPWEKP